MWLFGRKSKPRTPELPPALTGAMGEPPAVRGPQLVRRVEITVEREWTSTLVRRRTGESPAEGFGGPEAEGKTLEGWRPEQPEDSKKTAS